MALSQKVLTFSNFLSAKCNYIDPKRVLGSQNRARHMGSTHYMLATVIFISNPMPKVVLVTVEGWRGATRVMAKQFILLIINNLVHEIKLTHAEIKVLIQGIV